MEVNATSAVRYQWQKEDANGAFVDVSGATARTLNFANIQISQAGIYRVIASNPAGSATSLPATVAVGITPSITRHPADAKVTVGYGATFSVETHGTAPLSYQWLKNDVEVTGATSTTLDLADVKPSDIGAYSVRITNLYGEATSSAGNLSIFYAPVILTQPQDLDLSLIHI